MLSLIFRTGEWVEGEGVSLGIPPGFVNPSTVITQLTKAISIVLAIGIVVSVIYIMYSGIQMIMSSGDANKLKVAQASLQWAVIGLVVCFLANVLLGIVSSALGIDTSDISILDI